MKSIFDKIFNQIILENNLIYENEKYTQDIDIPRPNRMKTPENYYGSTGRNARDYELYIQDEAEAVFQDKYGREKGTKMWENILEIGNAMWKACDEILGERLSMESDLSDFFHQQHPELNQQCTDRNRYVNCTFYEGSYIVDWVWWILTRIINGEHFTKSYIQNCIPTFLGVLQLAPITTAILLKQANIDIEALSKTNSTPTKIDNTKIQNSDTKIQNEPIVNQAETTVPEQEDQVFELNGEKDHDRIIGILQKSRINKTLPISIDNIDINHAISLATTMNIKITDEAKRIRRGQAAAKLGFPQIAEVFK